MADISGGMQTICKDIVKGYEERRNSTQDRIKDVEAIRRQAENLRDNARKFVETCKKLHKEMAQDLRAGLEKDRQTLVKDVNSLRKDFRHKLKEIQTDLKEAAKSWAQMSETLNSKRKPKKR